MRRNLCGEAADVFISGKTSEHVIDLLYQGKCFNCPIPSLLEGLQFFFGHYPFLLDRLDTDGLQPICNDP